MSRGASPALGEERTCRQGNSCPASALFPPYIPGDPRRRGTENPGRSMSQWRKICGYCVSEGVPRRSFAVALIVGTILNLINQGDALLSGAHLDLTKIALTF